MTRPLRLLSLTGGAGSMVIGGWKDGAEILSNIEWRKYYAMTDTFKKNFGSDIYSKSSDVPAKEREKMVDADIAFGHP